MVCISNYLYEYRERLADGRGMYAPVCVCLWPLIRNHYNYREHAGGGAVRALRISEKDCGKDRKNKKRKNKNKNEINKSTREW